MSTRVYPKRKIDRTCNSHKNKVNYLMAALLLGHLEIRFRGTFVKSTVNPILEAQTFFGTSHYYEALD